MPFFDITSDDVEILGDALVKQRLAPKEMNPAELAAEEIANPFHVRLEFVEGVGRYALGERGEMETTLAGEVAAVVKVDLEIEGMSFRFLAENRSVDPFAPLKKSQSFFHG